MTASVTKRLDFRVEFSVDDRAALARPATWADVELLRAWKNAQRHAFFHKDEIGAEAQRRWFEAFSLRTDAQMFVLDLEARPIGCVGFRFVSADSVDLFNLILGAADVARRGVMSAFLQALEPGLARAGVRRVELRVLADNAPAIAFYERHGFTPYDAPADGASLALEKSLR